MKKSAPIGALINCESIRKLPTAIFGISSTMSSGLLDTMCRYTVNPVVVAIKIAGVSTVATLYRMNHLTWAAPIFAIKIRRRCLSIEVPKLAFFSKELAIRLSSGGVCITAKTN